MNNIIAFDTETKLIGKTQVVPDFICAQFAILTEEGKPFSWMRSRLCPDYQEHIRDMFTDPDMHIVTHNAAFDLSVVAKDMPELIPFIWKALDEERIHDTMIREMLYNLTASGDLDTIELHGVKTRAEYSLAALEKRYLGIDRSAEKEDGDSMRMNYEAVMDMPLAEWPDEFVKYGEEDPEGTLLVFLEQEVERQKLIDRTGYDPFVTEGFRVRVHFALQTMTTRGNRMDTERVLEVTKEFDTLYNDPALVRPLVLSTFISEYAKASGEKITAEFIAESLEAFEGLDKKEQKKWIGKGIVIPAVPPMPYKNGAKEHLETCYGHKEHPDYSGKTVKDCGCPPKVKGGQPEKGSNNALWAYIWKAGLENPLMEVWASDSLIAKLKEEGLFEDFIERGRVIKQNEVPELLCGPNGLPEGWRVSVDKEWLASFAILDPMLELLAERRKYAKIITSYLPGLYWVEGMENCPSFLEGEMSKLAGKTPADVVHSCFRPLKRTGRTSSYANKRGKGKNEKYTFPSMNGQQVDPRIRQCVIPREGYKLFSIDFSAMELGTAAQTCHSLFGYSVLGDLINEGKDVHSYLGCRIAKELDHWFGNIVADCSSNDMYDLFLEFKKDDAPCDSEQFAETFKETGKDEAPTLADFFAYYRKFAKPTGLGYPGGLGPKTFVSYAKATYGVTVDLDTASTLRNIWKSTFPEMAQYLVHVGKRCFDPNHASETKEDADGKKYKKQFYCYDTPLGMHRAKTDFCACANGQALQSISAEGALLGTCEIMRGISGTDEILKDDADGTANVRPTIFIHDELFGEIRDDDRLTERVERMQAILKECMEIITPDVRAGTEACLMNRWSKGAFPYYVDGVLKPYEDMIEGDEPEEIYYLANTKSYCAWESLFEGEVSGTLIRIDKEQFERMATGLSFNGDRYTTRRLKEAK